MQLDLIPGVIEHNRTTDGDSGLVAHKMVKCAVMVTTPTLEKGTRLEEHLGELFQGQGREFLVFFSNKIFIVPMSGRKRNR